MESEPVFPEERTSLRRTSLLVRVVGMLLAVMLLAMVGFAAWDIHGRYERLQEVRTRHTRLDLQLEEADRQIQAAELDLLNSLKARTLVGDVAFLFETNNPKIRQEALEFLYHELASEEVPSRRNAVESLRMLAKSDELNWAQRHSDICDHLLPLIHDKDPYLAWYVLDTLQELQPEKSHIAEELLRLASQPGHPLAPKATAALLTINPKSHLPGYAERRYPQGLLPWHRYPANGIFP